MAASHTIQPDSGVAPLDVTACGVGRARRRPGGVHVGGDRVFEVTLSGELGLRSIAELHACLKAALAEHQSIRIDTSRVESADASVLQLLVAAQKAAIATSKVMTLVVQAHAPMGRALIAAGFAAVDGAPLIPQARTWTVGTCA